MKPTEASLEKDKLIDKIETASIVIKNMRDRGDDTEGFEGYLKYLVNQL